MPSGINVISSDSHTDVSHDLTLGLLKKHKWKQQLHKFDDTKTREHRMRPAQASHTLFFLQFGFLFYFYLLLLPFYSFFPSLFLPLLTLLWCLSFPPPTSQFLLPQPPRFVSSLNLTEKHGWCKGHVMLSHDVNREFS